MTRYEGDPGLDYLLDFHDENFIVDEKRGHWVMFRVTQVPVSPEKPHGLDYSLTLHGPDGRRIAGFDNAHPVGGRKRGEPQDHMHRLDKVRSYEYKDATTLFADFWQLVNAMLEENGK